MAEQGSLVVFARTVTVLEVHPWLRLGVETWEHPAEGRDDLLVAGFETMARVAVLAGLTPGRGARSPMDTDEARFAAATTRAALREDAPARTSLEAANALLHDPARAGRRTQASTEVVVATLTRHGTEVVVAGGGAVFVRRDDDWFGVLAPGVLTDAADADWRGWAAEHPGASPDERDAAAVALLGDPGRWRNPAVGAFDSLRPQVAVVEDGWDELVLASAGARLDESILPRLEGWLAGLRAWETQHAVALGRAGATVHRDATVVRLRRLPLGDEADDPRGEIGDGRADAGGA